MARLLRMLIALTGLAALALGLLAWFAPADLAWRLSAGRAQPLELVGVSGSVWEGRAAQWIARGVALGPASWRVDRASAFARAPRGALGFEGDAVNGTLDFAASRGADGARVLTLDRVRGRFPATLLAPALDTPGLEFLGTIELDVAKVTLIDGRLATVDGHAEWRDLGVRGFGAISLPGLALTLAPTGPESFAGELRDLGGPLAVEGSVRVDAGQVLVEAVLREREPNPTLAQLLTLIGQRRPDGGSYLRIEGQLQPLFGDPP